MTYSLEKATKMKIAIQSTGEQCVFPLEIKSLSRSLFLRAWGGYEAREKEEKPQSNFDFPRFFFYLLSTRTSIVEKKEEKDPNNRSAARSCWQTLKEKKKKMKRRFWTF